MHKKPNAFRLLTHIANTARRTHGNPDGLIVGQCHLQHWNFYDLTEREYRTAKEILVQRKHIKIIETNRTRQKSTTGTTTCSTLVELISSTVYDINPEATDDRNDDRATTDRRPTDDKQEGIRKNKNEKEEEDKEYAQTAKRPRTTNDILFFDSEKGEYVGITEKDLTDWRTIYPHIDLAVELTKSITWLKSNPSKSKKSLWRKFLTNWLNRANDSAHNKKAYQAAGSAQGTDRRTKDVDGNPVENQYKGRF